MEAVLERQGRAVGGPKRRSGVAASSLTTVASRTVVGPFAATAGPVARPAERSGRLIGRRYRLRSLLGRGGMGRVWLAEDEVLGRCVALKQIVPDGAPTPRVDVHAARLIDEARAAGRVTHNGVVKIFDVLADGGLPWIVMEPLTGRTLAEAVRACGPLPVDQVAGIGLRVVDALRAIHRTGVVHRDVKPSNVHLGDDGRVVVIDFGVAVILDELSGRTVEPIAGSPAYLSPEQLGGGPPQPASDLFALGATLFAAAEGRAAFDRGNLFDTLNAVRDGRPAPFRRAGPLRWVVESLLAKDPEWRLDADAAYAALWNIQRSSAGGLPDVCHGQVVTRDAVRRRARKGG